ncbi:ADP-ribosylglycohydrolase family protein [Actinoplanes bogorensis]|uniref:ADP-ribosylglycohydrolase family protein n=1 Tax=Paractinoplanes bogorensis TaxID=1610840 RepID=A0ABS5YJW4_9ACTN|nr:ADP-ribosylglycohydrolase family protein [Actinoplanes bogorensis]MBU2663774.1 ADP-ribosylglycohydrolase family protein [Actinoplanes bogorensis]
MTMDRVLGGLAGAVIGDAFGAATENCSREFLTERGIWVETFTEPAEGAYAHGRPVGAFTDDSSQTLMLAELLVEQRGELRTSDMVRMLLAWSANEELAGRFTGPSTRAALQRIAGGEDPAVVGRGDSHHRTGETNGAAMKAAPAGWVHPGDPEGAVRMAQTIARASHNTTCGMAGACAIAAAVAQASVTDDFDTVVEAARYGAEAGERAGRSGGRDAGGPSLARRIEWAVGLADPERRITEVVDDVAYLVGTGMAAVESVPAAIAFAAYGQGDLRTTVIAATNAGSDSDTVASMAGAIAGTFAGRPGIDASWLQLVSEVNKLDLANLADELSRLS